MIEHQCNAYEGSLFIGPQQFQTLPSQAVSYTRLIWDVLELTAASDMGSSVPPPCAPWSNALKNILQTYLYVPRSQGTP